jgi:ABC-type lipoprotein release transport system permease subunit
MGTVAAALLVLWAGLRSRWRGWLGLALIIGLFAGAVETAAAAARRTDSAYPQLVAWSRPPDALVYSLPGEPAFADLAPAVLERLPQVTAGAALTTFAVLNPAVITLIAPADGQVPTALWHRKILSGRLPDPGRPNEVDISFTLAQALHLTTGGTLSVTMLGARGQPVPLRLRIAGVDAAPGEFPPQYSTGVDFVWATPAFYRHYRGELDGYATTAVRLRGGPAGMAAVQRDVSRLTRGQQVDDYLFSTQAVNTEHSIHLQAVVLWLVAALLSVVGVLVIGQLLARLSYLESADYPALRGVGMSRRQLLAAALGRTLVIGGAGAVVATLVAIALSAVFPVALAGIAEPYPGVNADWVVLGLGLAAVPCVTVACAAWPAWRATARAGAPRAPSAAAGPVARPLRAAPVLESVTATVGIRLALQRGAGRTALPVRSTIAAAVVGVAALTGALVFSSSLGHLLATPPLYGVTWQADMDNVQNGTLNAAAQSVGRDPQVAAWTADLVGAPLVIRGNQVTSLAVVGGRDAGSLQPVLIAGRLPRGAHEIMLGERTLAAAGARIGSVLTVSLADFHRRERLTVVGTAVFPTLGDTIGLGTGAEVTLAALHGLAPPRFQLPPFDGLLARFRPGVSPAAGVTALAARLQRVGPIAVEAQSPPADLLNFGEVQSMPLLLGGFLGVLALATIAHLLTTSVRRRRRDLAVLRTIGFTRAQVRSTVAWQAATLVVMALLIGIPVGIACGRLAWVIFARQIGILAVTDVPLPYLALLVAAAIALAVAIAAAPGESAARTRPALVLRSE